jgi:hypothetical protein
MSMCGVCVGYVTYVGVSGTRFVVMVVMSYTVIVVELSSNCRSRTVALSLTHESKMH